MNEILEIARVGLDAGPGLPVEDLFDLDLDVLVDDVLHEHPTPPGVYNQANQGLIKFDTSSY